jgi:hypothetical protein
MGVQQCTNNPVPPVIFPSLKTSISEKNILAKKSNEMLLTKKYNKFDMKNCFNFKNYQQYFELISLFNEKLKETVTKIIYINKFKPPKISNIHSKFFYYEFLDDLNYNKLFDVAMFVYQKIGNVYGSSQNYPKQELSKINFGLISKYRAYDYGNDDELSIITEKIIKRINFFSEEFPFKLKNLKKIFLSKKIYVFAYDKNLRLNFYLEPNNYDNENEINGLESNVELKEDYFYFNKIENNNENLSNYENLNKKYKKDIFLMNSDYITYIFFIIVHVLPYLKEKFKFSDLINLTINFAGQEANTELINYIMNSFNKYFPLGLGKVNIVNFRVDSLRKNITFRNEIDNIDYFRNLVLHNESFQFNLVKQIDINLLPIEYGGYHSLISFYDIQSNEIEGYKLEDFIFVILSMILINNDCKN